MSRYLGSRLKKIRRLGALPGLTKKTKKKKKRPGLKVIVERNRVSEKDLNIVFV
jgi:hypothetical protein